MVQRPQTMNAFEFVVLSSLRAEQLLRGCTPTVVGSHKIIITAQLEVATGKIGRVIPPQPDL
jgi:DNA-directed RNA polymerase subunit K/omega